MKKAFWRSLGSALLVLCAVAVAAAGDKDSDKEKDKKKDKPKRETFMATVLQTANMRLPGGQTYQLTMNIDQWTSVEDRKRLLGVLKEQGKDALLKELRKMKAGYIVPPRFAQQPSWEVDVASTFTTDKGRVVRLFTERPIAFAEQFRNTRSSEYEFGFVELRLDEKGEGEGIVVPAAQIRFNDDGQLEIETLPETTGPQKLIGVREWK